jgi:integrase/recombinase XerC
MLPRFTYKLKTFIQSDVDELLEATDSFIERLFENENAKLRAYRDRAFILTLADTGLRVHEACELIRGDIDQEKARAVIVGKGDKQGVIRFSERSLKAINDYFRVRAELDGASGKPLLSLPVFAQHAKSSGKKVEPITTKTGRDIVTYWVLRILGDAKKKTITPHTLRHYFVTEVVNTTGNIKTAKEMARHSNISVTDKYAQLNDAQLDREYHEIFNRPR